MFGKIKIAGILMTTFWAGINCLGFVGLNYRFSKSGRGDTEVERKRHNLAKENPHRAIGKRNKHMLKQLYFFNQRLRQIKIRQKYTPAMSLKQWLSTIGYFQSK